MIRLLIADSDPARREQRRAALTTDSEIAIAGMARDGQEAVHLAHTLRPDIALLSADLAAQDGWRTAEILTSDRALPTQVILLSETDSAEAMRHAMRAGARGHFAQSVVPTTLLQTIHDLYSEAQERQTSEFARAADPQMLTQVIAVCGAKGGIGKTTLAVNVSVALAQQREIPTTLLDLYTQFGDAALLLNLKPRRALADMGDIPPADFDLALLENCLERHDSGLSLLMSAREPSSLEAVSHLLLERVISLLKTKNRAVVLDVPPILHTTTLYALSHATCVLMVANLHDLSTLQDTRRLLLALKGTHVAPENIRIVLNRVSRQNRLKVADIENTLEHPITTQIANDGRIVPDSINNGIPFVLSHPQSQVAQSIQKLARELMQPGSVSSEIPNAITPRRRLFTLSRNEG